MRNPTALGLCALITLALVAGCDQGPPGNQTPDGADGDATTPMPDVNPAARIEGTGQLDTDPSAATAAAGSNPVLVATDGGPGPYLTNSAGSALYFVEGDMDGSKCVDECVDAWPPFLVADAAPTAGAQLQAAMLGTITRTDDSIQVTYNQHPLYRYSADTGAGRTAGNGVEDQWGHWHLVGPAGNALEVSEP